MCFLAFFLCESGWGFRAWRVVFWFGNYDGGGQMVEFVPLDLTAGCEHADCVLEEGF